MASAEFWATEAQGRGWCAKAWTNNGMPTYVRLTWASLAADLGHAVPGDCSEWEVAIFHTGTEAETVAAAWENREVA